MVDSGGQWPVWNAPAGESVRRDGYGGIARYVVPHVLDERLPSAFPRGLREQLHRDSGTRAGVDRLIAARLWSAFDERRIPYAAPPWHPGEGQRIRDPEWLWHRHGSGTCVDLALLLAGACLNEDLDTSLVMMQSPVEGHVAVLVRLGSTSGRGDLPLGVARTDCPGLGEVVDVDAFVDDDEVLLLDPTTATAASTDRSAESSHRHLVAKLREGFFRDVYLVDVTARQGLPEDRPLEAPNRSGTLRARLLGPARRTFDFPSHAAARAALREQAGGVVVLRGPEGVGKSTLAREIAAQADRGFGWFLTGSTRRAYQASLAEMELFERGEALTDLDAEFQAELARSALERLDDELGDWVVVIDNANDGAEALGQLPRPRDGQLLIITTTAPADKWRGFRSVELRPLEPRDLAKVKVDAALGPVVAGSPLLLSAFAALAHRVAEVAAELPPDELTGVDAGARLYWSLLRRHLGHLVPLAERLSLLPPDAIDGAAEDELGVGSMADLVDAGLLTPLSHRTFSMHRVFGRTVRARAADEGTLTDAAVQVLGSARLTADLTRAGDTSVTRELAGALTSSTDPLALARLAALQEFHDGLKTSLETYRRAQGLLEADLDVLARPDAAAALADCHHARAREVNQRRLSDVTLGDLRAAQQWVARALEIRSEGDPVQREKHLALGALLRQRATHFLPEGSEEEIRELRAVAEDLDGSWERRRALLGDGHPLVDRALFNRAGVRIRLAQAEPEQAAVHLGTAENVYRTTLQFREQFYAENSPLLAASVAGVATWGYFALQLRTAPSPRETFIEAMEHGHRSMRVRLSLPLNSDVVKSAEILAKLSLLQVDRFGGEAETTAKNAVAEIERFRALDRGAAAAAVPVPREEPRADVVGGPSAAPSVP